MNTFQEHPVLIVLIGIALKYMIGQRRFKRRGIGGLQHYPNYFTAVITIFLERVIGWLAILAIIYGLFKMCCSNPQQYNKPTVAQTQNNTQHIKKQHHGKHKMSLRPVDGQRAYRPQ